MPSSVGVTCVVQARMGSSRLPGKVLAPLGGRPMLRFMLDRLAPLDLAHLVVATSTHARDDAVAREAASAGVAVVRGSEHDVLDRMRSALDAHPADTVVRLTGDCPLVDPALVSAAIALHCETGADYTSNVLPRTFPKGLDVEVMSAGALLEAALEATDPPEREHVTPFLYRHPERFRLANLWCPEDLGEERWTVDTPEDLEFVRDVVDQIGADRLAWQDILDRIGRRYRPAPGLPHLRPAREADAALLLQWQVEPDALPSRTDPATRTWIGEIDSRAVGSVRIDVRNGQADTSVVVAPGDSGAMNGTALLKAACRMLEPDFQVQSFRADVDAHDVVAIRTFEQAGFRRVGASDETLTFVRSKEAP